MTTAVFFALDGTLLERSASREAVLGEALAAELGDAPASLVETYTDAFEAQVDTLEPEPHLAGMRAVAAELMDAAVDTDPGALLAALREAELDATAVPDGARSAPTALAEDYPLGVVTNGDRAWQTWKIEAHDLPVGTVVTAAEAGARKPDPAPYDLARERVTAEEYVMVGDGYEQDVEGARRAGFVPIHYENEGPNLWRTLEALL